jgi:hypothetical protein
VLAWLPTYATAAHIFSRLPDRKSLRADHLLWKQAHLQDANGRVYVVTLPTHQLSVAPKAADFRNLMGVLTNVKKPRCDMYDSALVPVALVNKLVSLADHPSSRILQEFAIGAIPH